jgi:type IV pilus assembly protein PilA
VIEMNAAITIAKAKMCAKKRASSRGLTILELIAVIVIIAILAVLALIGYGRWIRSSKMTEAQNMIQKIRDAEERRKAETGSYLDVSNGLGVGNLYPKATPGKVSTQWGAQCTVCVSDWANLAITPDGPVQFGYAVVAGDTTKTPGQKGVNVTIGGNAVTFPNPTGPWYIVEAMSDLDGNGVFCTIIGTSWDNTLMIDNEGE